MTLHEYFKQELAAGRIDHKLRAKHNPTDDSFEFYIHPDGANGNTADFILWEQPDNGADLLTPKDLVKPIPVEEFRKFMEANGAFMSNHSMKDPEIEQLEAELAKHRKDDSHNRELYKAALSKIAELQEQLTDRERERGA